MIKMFSEKNKCEITCVNFKKKIFIVMCKHFLGERNTKKHYLSYNQSLRNRKTKKIHKKNIIILPETKFKKLERYFNNTKPSK